MSEFWAKRLLVGAAIVLCLTSIGLFGARAGLSPAKELNGLGPALPHELAELTLSAENSGRPARAAAYVWSATRMGSTLRLRGLVPSEEDRRTVLGMVKAHFADLEVEDRLKVTEGGPPREQWLGAVSFGLKQLAHLKQGSARLLNAGLKVEGEARSGADYAEVKKALAGPMPIGLTILNDNVRPPVADPFIFVASLSPNALTLTGSVPSEEMRKDVKELARRLFERPMLDDQLELASGAPKKWGDAVEASLRALSRLDSGKVSLSGLALAIEGVAPDKSTAIAISYQLKQDLPALFSSSESIRWKEADISSNVQGPGAPLLKRILQPEGGPITGALPWTEPAPILGRR
jgi:hypothetical protein